MEILTCMRSQVHRTKNNSIFILNLFALQFISLIAINRLDQFYLKIAQSILIFGYEKTPSMLLILINFIFNASLISLFLIFLLWTSFRYRKLIIQLFAIVLLNFKYIFLIPVGSININALIDSSVPVQYRVYCAVNMGVTFILSAVQLYTNWSNRFIEKDFCNRRQNSILCLLFQFSFLFSSIIFGSLIGALFLIAISIFRAYQVAITVQYPLIQKSTFFYSSFNIYMCVIFLVGEGKIKFIDLTFKLIIGIIVCIYFSKNACNFINSWYGSSKTLYKFNNSVGASSSDNSKVPKNDINQKQGVQLQNENKTQNSYKDIIILSKILLNRSSTLKYDMDQRQWQMWWQKFNIIIVIHKVNCINDKCECKLPSNKNTHAFSNQQTKIIMEDLKKMMTKLLEKEKTGDIRIMGIYVEIQLAKQPLKGYYQIMKMQKQQISMANQVDLQCLLIQTRQCFNRLFIKNNIQNNNLPLLKIIKFEEQIQNIQLQIKNVLELTINFYQLFTLNTIKILQILHDSKKIFLIKEKINQKFYNLVLNYPDNLYVNFLSFIFYQYLQVYKSKQKQLKSITQQKNLKKRLFQKEDNDVFNPEYGVIYIDLVEQRGKIKKITKNICELYGHSYQDMIFFNINQFMPRIFAKNHYKFLNNFIQLGKIKILASKKRILFAKNKNKYIFPLQARLKTEHLLSNQFGVTALLKKQQTGSGFIMFNLNGKIEEVSQNVYKTIFMSSMKGEVDKVRRLCLIKMIPNLLHLLTDPNFNQFQDKIYQSFFVFSNHSDMLEKFRVYRQPKNYGSSTYGGSTYLSGTLDLQQTSNQLSNNSNNYGYVYFVEVFKSFLNELNIIKLNAFLITYKVSRVKTQQFSIFLLEILTIESAQESHLIFIQQFQKLAEHLNIYQQHGNIAQNFQKFKQLIDRNDVVNFMYSKNVSMQRKKYNDAIKSYKNRNKKKEKKKILTIGQDQPNMEAAKSIQSNSAINLEQFGKGVINQQIQRGGSERSSVTDQSQSQSKKQMLINAFNNNDSGINKGFISFVNVMVVVKFGVLIYFIIISLSQIEMLRNGQFKDIINLQTRYVYEFRLASNHILDYYKIQKNRGYNISSKQINEINTIIQDLNKKFMQAILKINDLYNVKLVSTQKLQYTRLIQVYDTQLKNFRNMSIIQLLNQLNYIIRTQLTENKDQFLQINYQLVHNIFKYISQHLSKPSNNSSLNNIRQIIFITFGLYQFMCIVIVVLWVPMLYIISKKQKRIINFLSTMNVKQLKKLTFKLRMIWQHMKSSKNNQINQIMSMLHDEKTQPNYDMDKQKNIIRNIRLISENNAFSIKPKHVVVFILLFILFFSILPISFYLNIATDQSYFTSILSLIEENSFLACKAPLLININLINVNKIFQDKSLRILSNDIYAQSKVDYFNLNSYVSKANDLTKNLINSNGQLTKFNENICSQLQCSQEQQNKNVKFYDQISLIRNAFYQIDLLNVATTSNDPKQTLDKWIEETSLTQMLNWINKIYLFAHKWNTRFASLIENSLKNTENRLIIISSVLTPFYLLAIIYIQYKIIKKMGGILQDAESVHMHFPVQILVENTYLTSYFNEKIKNNK